MINSIGEYDLSVTVGRVVSPAVRMLPPLTSSEPFKHQINKTLQTAMTTFLVCIQVTSAKVSKSNLLVGHYQCNHQENPKAKCQSQEIHYSLFRLQLIFDFDLQAMCYT